MNYKEVLCILENVYHDVTNVYSVLRQKAVAEKDIVKRVYRRLNNCNYFIVSLKSILYKDSTKISLRILKIVMCKTVNKNEILEELN